MSDRETESAAARGGARGIHGWAEIGRNRERHREICTRTRAHPCAHASTHTHILGQTLDNVDVVIFVY